MARQEINSVDYFPFICKEGKAMFYIETKYGNDGYAVWVKILRQLAVTNYHYLNLSDTTDLMYLSAKCRVSEDVLMAIIDDLTILGEFDEELWQNNKIIWCQKFIDSISDAYKKRRNQCIDRNLLLRLLVSKGVLKPIKSIPNEPKSIPQVSELPQRKEKKRKENKTKEKETPNGVGGNFEKMGFLGQARIKWKEKFPDYVWLDTDNDAINRLENLIKTYLKQQKQNNGHAEFAANKAEIMEIFEKIISSPPPFYADKMSVDIINRKFNEFVGFALDAGSKSNPKSKYEMFVKMHPTMFDSRGNPINQGNGFKELEGKMIPIISSQ